MRRERTVWLLILCLFTAVGLLAQVVITSTVVGTVTDAQGAVVAGWRSGLHSKDFQRQEQDVLLRFLRTPA